MHPATALLPLALLVPLALPAAAGPANERSYAVRVIPDPTGEVPTYGHCGALDATVLGYNVGGDARLVRVPAGRTLRVTLKAEPGALTGAVGPDWVLRIHDQQWRELARSTTAKTTVARRFTAAQQVWLLACNLRGRPDAVVTYSVR